MTFDRCQCFIYRVRARLVLRGLQRRVMTRNVLDAIVAVVKIELEKGNVPTSPKLEQSTHDHLFHRGNRC